MHLLVFEPRLGGHHLSWLKYVAEDLLAGGHAVSLAIDNRQSETIAAHLASLWSAVRTVDVYDRRGKFRDGSKIGALNLCLRESGADEVFLNNFDEIASNCLRRAAVGFLPPPALHGRLNGVYFRPRFLAGIYFPPGNWLKHYGFYKLCRSSWLKRIFLLDETLIAAAEKRYPNTAFHLLPDPWDGDFSGNRQGARQTLQIPDDKFVLLNYGIGDRRKGLYLVIQALLTDLPSSKDVFLLCAGKVAEDKDILQGLQKLEQLGKARVLNRYVSDQEETLCFSATDAVLLPYYGHFGSSGVLSRAAAAGRIIIASDEGLVGYRVGKHQLGTLFQSGSVPHLQEAIAAAAALTPKEKEQYRHRLLNYASTCDRQAFRQALLLPFSRGER